MLFFFFNPGNNDIIQTASLFFHCVDFQTKHGQNIGKLFRCEIKINIFFEPVIGNVHIRTPLFKKLELTQEADIVFKQQSHIVDTILQHGNTLDTHAERKS